MPPSETIRSGMVQSILLDGRDVPCRVVRSKTARKLRIKIRPEEVEVVVPEARDLAEGLVFVVENQAWVIDQLERARRLRFMRRPEQRLQGQILFRGELVPVKVVRVESWQGPNKVALGDDEIRITVGPRSRVPAWKSLENWLRQQARKSIEESLKDVVRQVKRTPNRIYIMDQRTKWGNCSGLGNLSFNWRLIMAPDEVLRYIVTHEMVHLVIPDHSQKFWLTVQSLYPKTDRARQWLVANGPQLMVRLGTLFEEACLTTEG